ncbi:hypothetical protein CK203_108612 [Vitis vinifera]|uniref:Integrase catalytic domain-containing protein n=1 Tax=Vitis vinifera TaxID=29760 RepID=A0A438CY55_VITVI|nr:hypothetical protein CK203_108612 [Vitis vinifera]
MSEFVTCFDEISDGNNDMSISSIWLVSQHFPLIAPPAPTTHVCDVDDVGDTDDPLGGQSECDSDTEDRKVTPISSSTELIDLLGSYLDAFAWSYEVMSGLDPSIVQHHLPILPHASQSNDDFTLPHIDMLVNSTAGHSMLSFMDGVMPFGLKNVGATYQRAATTLFPDMMHRDLRPVLTGKAHEMIIWPFYQYLMTDRLNDDFPDEQFISVTSIKGWRLYFDGAANQSGFSISVLLISPQGIIFPDQSRFAFSNHHRLTNNIVEYKACIIGLETTLDLGVRQLEIHGDSNLVIHQTQGMHFRGDRPMALSLLYLDRSFADRVIREVHVGCLCPHMGGHMLTHKIMKTGYFWLTMETDCLLVCTEVDSGQSGQVHQIAYYLLYGIPHELISDRGVHFRGEVDTLVQEYGIQHHRSSAYKPQTNGSVEAANKNIKRILRKMVETSQDWLEKLHFALWAYCTYFCTSIGATPYSLVYGMEAVLPIDIEMGSLKEALKQQIFEVEWAQSLYD